MSTDLNIIITLLFVCLQLKCCSWYNDQLINNYRRINTPTGDWPCVEHTRRSSEIFNNLNTLNWATEIAESQPYAILKTL